VFPSHVTVSRMRMSKSITFVLVHGAWHGGWAWKKVRALLGAAGHQVFTPTLTGLGERRHLATRDIDLDTHVRDILGVLEYEDLQQVVLVGHSYAGMVVSAVAAEDSRRLARLVYLDAFLPENGRALIDYVPKMVASYEEAVVTRGDGWRLPFSSALSLEALGVTDPSDIAWMGPRMDDQPYKTFCQPLILPPDRAITVPCVYLLSSERPHYLAAADRAVQRGFAIRKISCAGHDAMVTHPQEVADALVRASANA